MATKDAGKAVLDAAPQAELVLETGLNAEPAENTAVEESLADLSGLYAPQIGREVGIAEEEVLRFAQGQEVNVVALEPPLRIMQLRLQEIAGDAMRQVDQMLTERAGGSEADKAFAWAAVETAKVTLPADSPLRTEACTRIAAGMNDAGKRLRDYPHLRYVTETPAMAA